MKPPVDNFKLEKYPKGSITQWFGENPSLYSRWGLRAHNGVDCVAYHGAPLYSVEDAKVVMVDEDLDGFGRSIRLRSIAMDKGRYRDWVYGHCDTILVTEGQTVKAGEQIGTMGNTGFVVSGGVEYWGGNNPDNRGTHLHLGLRYLIPDKTGWKYRGDNIRYIVENADNGYKGRVDPYPFLIDKTDVVQQMYRQLLTIQSMINSIKSKLGIK